MTSELAALATATLLGFAHVIAAWLATRPQRRYRISTVNAGSEAPPVANGLAVRLKRARRDFVESLVFFAAAVYVVHAGDAESPGTAWSAWIFVIARAAYLIASASGARFIAAVMWNLGSFATLTLLLAPAVPYW
jgi:uncharacterized MAPEG superfamily protein